MSEKRIGDTVWLTREQVQRWPVAFLELPFLIESQAHLNAYNASLYPQINLEEIKMTEAAVLAGLLEGGENLGGTISGTIRIILREMRSETEVARLAKRIAKHFNLPPLETHE